MISLGKSCTSKLARTFRLLLTGTVSNQQNVLAHRDDQGFVGALRLEAIA